MVLSAMVTTLVTYGDNSHEATRILNTKWGSRTQIKALEICSKPMAESPGKWLRLENLFSYLVLHRVLRQRLVEDLCPRAICANLSLFFQSISLRKKM